jgi:Uma2 family endonuclease
MIDMTARPRVRFLATDIWDAPDNGKIYEVIEGELYVSPAPSWKHQGAVTALAAMLWTFVRGRKLGFVVSAPTGLVLNEHNGVEPDIIYISNARANIITERGVEGTPDLVVEALSPSTAARDRGIKMRRYAASGIPHYWILDPANNTLEAYRLDGVIYQLEGVYGPGEIFRPTLFPGLEIPIDELWV